MVKYAVMTFADYPLLSLLWVVSNVVSKAVSEIVPNVDLDFCRFVEQLNSCVVECLGSRLEIVFGFVSETEKGFLWEDKQAISSTSMPALQLQC